MPPAGEVRRPQWWVDLLPEGVCIVPTPMPHREAAALDHGASRLDMQITDHVCKGAILLTISVRSILLTVPQCMWVLH